MKTSKPAPDGVELGAVDSILVLDEGVSVRAQLVRLGFKPVRTAYREVAEWYVTRRKAAHVNRLNCATIYYRIGGPRDRKD